jgi:hypothetical protein
MNEEHRLMQVSSHVTSFVGRVGVIGLCSCGWLAGEEGEDTKIAVRMLEKAFDEHLGEQPPGRVAPFQTQYS